MSTASAVLRDVRFALTSLRRSPGFTLIAVVILGLGIGANTAAFGLLNEVLLRPLPYPESDRLERIYRATAQSSRGGIAPADYVDLQREAAGYGEIAAYAYSDMSLAAPGSPAELAAGARVSANLFSTLGVEPQLGRGFRPDEDVPGSHRVLVLSNRYWQSRFGGDPGIVGRSIRVDGEVHDVIGVMPAALDDWRHLGSVELFRPLGLTGAEAADRTSTRLRLVGRRAGSVTPEQAGAFVASFGRRLAADHPAAHAGTAWRTVPLERSVAPEFAPALLSMLIGLATFVLLIACSNLANLLLVRTMGRAREFAVRTALGASRARLLRPLLTESLLLALGGGACAVVFAAWTNAWLRSTGDGVHALDWRVLSWAFGVSLSTVLAFGVVPTLFALRLDPNRTLRDGSRGTTGGRGDRRFRNLLIVGQFALAMVLLAGAGLFVRGLDTLNHRRFGWESDRVVTGTIVLPAASYGGAPEVARFQRLVLERLRALPGVASVSLSYSMPYFGLAESRRFQVAGRDAAESGREPMAAVNGVSPGYFETVGTPLLGGRAFAPADSLAAPRVFVINQAMARGLFGADSPIGKRIALTGGDDVEWGEVVGVAADVGSVYPDRSAMTYQLYQPLAQEPRHLAEVAVRTTGGAAPALVESIRATIASLDPDLPVRSLRPAAAVIAEANDQWGKLARILGFLAALGLGLASLGIYGVVTRTSAQRTGEFGIRLALGAVAGDISRLVLVSGAKLALIGCGVGLLGAVGVARLLGSFFPNMQTSSAPVLAGVTLLLFAVALVACYLPARQAARRSLAATMRAL